jgi:hypothetical protein
MRASAPFLSGLLLVSGVSFAGACSSVLGGFEVSALASSGASGSGGAALVGYECAWNDTKPALIQSYPADGKEFLSEAYVAERGASGKARVLTYVREADKGRLDVYDPDAPNNMLSLLGVSEVLHVGRLSSVATGILAVLESGADFRLVMLELPDGVDKLVEHLLLAPADWSVYPSNPRFSGRFTPVDLQSPSRSVDVVVAFNSAATTMSAGYGNFTAQGGKMVSFVDPQLAEFADGMTVVS